LTDNSGGGGREVGGTSCAEAGTSCAEAGTSCAEGTSAKTSAETQGGRASWRAGEC